MGQTENKAIDTQRVAELIKQIEEQERELAQRNQVLAEARKSVAAVESAIGELKQNLAEELVDLLPKAKRAKHPAPSVAPAAGGRQQGIGEAALALFADGQPHSIAEVDATLQAQGYTPKNTAMQLSMFSRAGKLKRVGRGAYVKKD